MTAQTLLLGVNIDHVATLRQARGTRYPDPVRAARLCEAAGADGITLHLREDRRHIQDDDVVRMAKHIETRMNLEIAVTDFMIDFACYIKPQHVCLVPEKREELTTEGGLDVAGQMARIRHATQVLSAAGCEVSLFIDPDPRQIDAAISCGAPTIEIHTGAYADAHEPEQQQQELQRILESIHYANGKLIINAGHGLNYENVMPIAKIAAINELNIGHAIVAQSIYVGIEKAVQDMRYLMDSARASL